MGDLSLWDPHLQSLPQDRPSPPDPNGTPPIPFLYLSLDAGPIDLLVGSILRPEEQHVCPRKDTRIPVAFVDLRVGG